MKVRQREIFTTIHSEGGLLPSDLLERLSESKSGLEGLDPETFHLEPGETLNQAVNRSWNRLTAAWANFSTQRKDSGSGSRTTLTRERWLLILFRELGYGRLASEKAVEVDGKTYPVSHRYHRSPIHLVGFQFDLDTKTKGAVGAARTSPHSLVQEILNRNENFVWGFVSNGLRLRVLRDNASLTRMAYLEFDLEAMMDGEIYSDFVILWLICHQSRIEAERPEECWLEHWTNAAKERGTRALDSLRGGVEQAIQTLGEGFLSHPANTALKEALRHGKLSKQDFYRELLRLVYRLIFLFAAEDRGLLCTKEAEPAAKTLYQQHYSAGRLRRLAERRRGTRHPDLYRSLKMVMQHLGSDIGCPALALPALGSYLWSKEAVTHLASADIYNTHLLNAVRHLGFTIQGQILRTVDYKNLGAEELGSIYESLLELHPQIDSAAATFELRTAAGHERKTTGSYYTPASLIRCLLDSALTPVLDRASAANDPEKSILDIKVCDPACGSGHFLIAAAHRIAKRLAAVRTGDEEPSPEATRNALRDVIGRCIYGVDINPMSVELCKVGLWLEALVPGKALSFLDHHIQSGNSLFGATPALIAAGIPAEAFVPLEGDDIKIASGLSKRNKAERKHKGQRELFDYSSGSPVAISLETKKTLEGIEKADDASPESVRKKADAYDRLAQSAEFARARLIADAWCAAFVWRKATGAPEAMTQGVFDQLTENPDSVNRSIREEIATLAAQYRFFHFHLAFPEVFGIPTNHPPTNKAMGWDGGFSVLLGNPPWEHVELKEKEWFAECAPTISEAGTAAIRKRMIAQLATSDPGLFQRYQFAKRAYDGLRSFCSGGAFPFCGRGRINTYAVFTELVRNLTAPGGRVGYIVPSGIALDDTTKLFFQDLVDSGHLTTLFEFENVGFFSAGKGHMVRFAILTLRNEPQPRTPAPIRFMFQGQRLEELADPERVFELTRDDFVSINPNSRTCPIFRTRRDADLNRTLYRKFPIFLREDDPPQNPWGVSFSQGLFNMASDSACFRTKGALIEEGYSLSGNVFLRKRERMLPLYEAKLIHQFDHRYGDFATLAPGSAGHILPIVPESAKRDPAYAPLSRYWVSSEEVDARTPESWKADWLIGWRDVTDARASARSVVASIIPRYGCGDTFLLMFPAASPRSIAALLANLGSFALDYLARQKIGGLHLKYNVFKQLLLLEPKAYQQPCTWDRTVLVSDWLAPRVVELSCTSHDLVGFAKSLGFPGKPFRWDPRRRYVLLREIDAAFFHLYGISRQDVDYILDTFPIIRKDEEKELGEYRTKHVVLETYDAMKMAIESGTPYRSRLDPPPGDPGMSHPDANPTTQRRLAAP